jgi:hypothetical protein
MLERSEQAPPDWGQEHTQTEVRTVVLDESPDLVLFQELPGIVPYVETHDMIRSNPRSHSGNLATLVGHDVMDEQPTFTAIAGVGLLTTFVDRDLTVANVHLAPGKAGAQLRLEQLQAVVDASPTADLAVIGDTNTRTDEEQAIAQLGLTGPRPPEPTWNGRKNRFRGRSGEFLAYFSRPFVTADLQVTELRVLSDRWVAVDGARFHLSDHFGFAGSISNRGS